MNPRHVQEHIHRHREEGYGEPPSVRNSRRSQPVDDGVEQKGDEETKVDAGTSGADGELCAVDVEGASVNLMTDRSVEGVQQ